MNVRVFNMDLAEKIGLSEAILLQQIHYWIEKCGKENGDRRWIYNSVRQWREQFSCWSTNKIIRVIESLENIKLIDVKILNPHSMNRTKSYSINYDHEILSQYPLVPVASPKQVNPFTQKGKTHLPKTGKCVHPKRVTPATETTTESTSETTTKQGEVSWVDEISLWYNKQAEWYREAINNYIDEVGIRSDARDPDSYRWGIIRRIRNGTARGFRATSPSEMDELVKGMFG